MKVIRVFPRRTKATPDDRLVRVAEPPGFFDSCDEVHISVAFTWDLPFAEVLAKQWLDVAPVKIGGPATGEGGGDFIPGVYLKRGYTITSRGCPNKCWFCSVWKREGNVRELPIRDGWIVQDDNLLACSDNHIRAVFDMLERQPKKAQLTGGLEAARLKDWQAKRLRELKPKQVFFAYDKPEDLEPLRLAGKKLFEQGFTRAGKVLRSYVFCGYPKDTTEAAENRMFQALDAGFIPMAMLWKSEKDESRPKMWTDFQRTWARPASIHARIQEAIP